MRFVFFVNYKNQFYFIGLSSRNTSDPIIEEQSENSFPLSMTPQFCSTRMEWIDQADDANEKKE